MQSAQSPNPLPVIEYGRHTQRVIDLVERMFFWRGICGWGFAIYAVGLFFPYGPLWLAAFAVQFFAAVMTLISIAKVGGSAVNAGYAFRHVLLATLLTPLLFTGIFLVPVLVRSDLLKWERLEAPEPADAG